MRDIDISIDSRSEMQLHIPSRSLVSESIENVTFGGDSNDKTFVFVKQVPASEWVIVHPLDKYPSITVVDSGGNVCVGNVEYVSKTEIICRFSAAFSGKAYLN